MRWLVIIVLSLSLLIPGCATLQEWSLDFAKSDTENAKAVRDVSAELMKGWPTWSGLLKGILGDRIKDFPMRALEAWRELDYLTYCVDNSKYPPDFIKEPPCPTMPLSDYHLGYYSGTRLRMLFGTIIEGFKLYAPDLVAKLPTELLGLL